MAILIKMGVTIAVVLALSSIAERAGPRVAGLLSGYPLGAAIALFFIGIEIGPDFAAESAVYTLVGLVGTQMFVYVYFRVSTALKHGVIPISSLAALSGYLFTAWILQSISFSRWGAVGVPVMAIFIFTYLFRKIQNVSIARRIRYDFKVLFLRAGLAGLIILAVTGAAQAVGPAWAGLFSAFPTTLFPLVLIIHITYGTPEVHTLIKNFPLGVGSLVVYCLSVSVFYLSFGVYWGTFLSLIAATLYLLGCGSIIRRFTV